jgi:hypothetical protein
VLLVPAVGIELTTYRLQGGFMYNYKSLFRQYVT